MKSPLGKLKGFKLPGKGRDGKSSKSNLLTSTYVEDLAQASQDMQDMRDCYDSLLSAAAATANSAYEFSESLHEIGCCLREKTALHDYEGSANVLSMLGSVQLELQKLVDNYRSHVLVTITKPSQSLLNEIKNVEEMKKLCDEKRSVYDYMVAQQKQKGKHRGGKHEQFTVDQLQRARDEYNENATLFVFRLKSLKEGQTRSLLTQAARHHAAQLHLFQKGLKSLEAVDPHVRDVAEKQHIDYYFQGLYDEGKVLIYDERDHGIEAKEEVELSFNRRYDRQEIGMLPSRSSMEMDDFDISFPQPSTTYSENVSRQHRVSSHSAPIFLERKSEETEKFKQIKALNACVLPTPNDVKARTSQPSSHGNAPEIGGVTHSFWHSSPMEQWKHDKENSNGQKLNPSRADKTNISNPQLPPPLTEGLTGLQREMYDLLDKKSLRLSHSGPIATKGASPKTALSATIPSPRGERASGLLYRLPVIQKTPTPNSSPPPVSSPRISELHELPRPPGNMPSRRGNSSSLIDHSAPLVRAPDDAVGDKVSSSSGTRLASPLPTPPLAMARSYSIPSRGQRSTTIFASKFLESSKLIDPKEVESLPLTLSFSNIESTPVLAAHPERL